MELIILESGGMTSFVFHCLLIIFFGFVLYNIYFNPKFIEDSGFKSSEANLLFKGPVGTIILTFFIVSTILHLIIIILLSNLTGKDIFII